MDKRNIATYLPHTYVHTYTVYMCVCPIYIQIYVHLYNRDVNIKISLLLRKKEPSWEIFKYPRIVVFYRKGDWTVFRHHVGVSSLE